jgi:hypothetical protein
VCGANKSISYGLKLERLWPSEVSILASKLRILCLSVSINSGFGSVEISIHRKRIPHELPKVRSDLLSDLLCGRRKFEN